MSTDLFLIAHKVHGLPAFDVATQMECPECQSLGCPECDDLGYWWVVPTSGHRAYPWCSTIHLCHEDGSVSFKFPPGLPGPMPPNLPDHYPHHSVPTISLAEALGIRPKPSPPIVRRF